VYNYKDVDKLHIRFLKSLLGVKKQTPNSAVYGEIGRFPLSVICKLRSLKFWVNFLKKINSPLFRMYCDQGNNISGPCWAKRINSLLDQLGCSDYRTNINGGDVQRKNVVNNVDKSSLWAP